MSSEWRLNWRQKTRNGRALPALQVINIVVAVLFALFAAGMQNNHWTISHLGHQALHYGLPFGLLVGFLVGLTSVGEALVAPVLILGYHLTQNMAVNVVFVALVI